MSAILEINPTAAPRAVRRYTAEDLLNRADLGRCELIRGKVVPMCLPNQEHGELLIRVGTSLDNFCMKTGLGSVRAGDSGLLIERDPDTVRGPDVYFISAARRPPKEAQKGYLNVAPELCVEIVSPKDRWSKLHRKIEAYLAFGVKIVWVIDPQTRSAYVYKQNKQVVLLDADGVLSGEDVLPGFALPLKDLFAILD